jgi:anti-anti-sigma regulatory factor
MQSLEVENGVLKVKEDLYWDIEDEFQKAVNALLDSPANELTIDLSRATFIFSPFMSHLVRFCLTAKERGKVASIVVNRRLEEVFRSSGLMDELPIRVVAHNNAG